MLQNPAPWVCFGAKFLGVVYAFLVGCFDGVGMADHGAVDYALGAHEPLLEDAEVLTPETWVRSDLRTALDTENKYAIFVGEFFVFSEAFRFLEPTSGAPKT